MAHVFRLANEDQSYTIDLLNGTYKLVDQSWTTQTPTPKTSYNHVLYGAQASLEYYQPVTETFDLIGEGTTAVLLAAITELESVIDDVRRYNARSRGSKAWWLEWNADGEDPKRSLIYALEFDYAAKVSISPFMECQAHLAKLGIVHHPFWENTTSETTGTTISVNNIGGTVQYWAIAGNTPARIARTLIEARTSTVGNGPSQLWLGIREENQGFANFNPRWLLESGAAWTDTAAVPGTGMETDFATTTTMADRVLINIAQVAAANGHTDYDHFQGTYLVLLLCDVDTGAVGIEMEWGYRGENVCEEVFVENVVPMFYEMGTVSFPPWQGDDYAGVEFMARCRIDLRAEVLDGAPTLTMRRLVLIPADRMLRIDGANLEALGVGTDAYIDVRENDTLVGFCRGTVEITNSLDIGPSEWYIPTGNSILVFAGQDDEADGGWDGATVDITLTYYPRWPAYRLDSVT